MNEKCPSQSHPMFKEIENLLGGKSEALFLAKYFTDENGDINYPPLEEIKDIFDNLTAVELDHINNLKSDEFKLQRINNQIDILNTVISNRKMTKRQKETLGRFMKMSEEYKKLLEDNINAPIDDIRRITYAATAFTGTSVFYGDPKDYIDYKNYGISIHEIADIILKESLENNVEMNTLLTKEKIENILKELAEKYPFEINSLTIDEILSDTINLLEVVSNKSGYIILPELTIIGKTKKSQNTGMSNMLVGRLDAIMIDPDGEVVIIDHKTKKVKDMVSFENDQPMIDENSVIRALASIEHTVNLSPNVPVGQEFLNSDLNERTAYDTWTLQTSAYENMLLQNNIKVKDKIINVLFYDVDLSREYKGSFVYVFDKQNYYDRAFSNEVLFDYNGKTTIEGKKKNRLGKRIEAIIDAVNEEIPISEKQKSEKVLNEGSTTLNINPDDAEANKFLKEIQENIVNQINDIWNKIKAEKQKPEELQNKSYIEILETRKDTIYKMEDVINKSKLDAEFAKSLAFYDAIENLGIEMTKQIEQAYIINENKEVNSQDIKRISTIFNFNKDAVILINIANDIITAENERRREIIKNNPNSDLKIIDYDNKLRIDIQNIEEQINIIDGIYRKKALQNAIKIIQMIPKKAHAKSLQELIDYYQPRIEKLEKELAKLKNNEVLGLFPSIKHGILSYMNKTYKEGLSKMLDEKNPGLIKAIENLEMQIEKERLLMAGFELTDDSLENFILGITNPDSDFYISAQNTFNHDSFLSGLLLDNFIATASNSGIELASFVWMYKQAERDAYHNLQRNTKLVNLDKKYRKMVESGWNITDINNALIQEVEEIKYINGEERKETTLNLVTPYSKEYKDTYEKFKADMKSLGKERKELRNEAYSINPKTNPEKYSEANNIYLEKTKEFYSKLDEYQTWLRENTSLPFIDELYLLDSILPIEIREQIQDKRYEQERLMYLFNNGFEEILDVDEDLERINELEIEIRKIKNEYKDKHPEHAEAIERSNEFYEFEYDDTSFEKYRRKVENLYIDNKPKYEQWLKLNQVKRPNAKWYNDVNELYEELRTLKTSDTILNELFEKRRNIIRNYKASDSIFNPKYLTDEDIDTLDSLQYEIEERISQLIKINNANKKSGIKDPNIKRIMEINEELNKISQERYNPKYVDYFDTTYKELANKYKKFQNIQNELIVKRKENDVEAIKILAKSLMIAETNYKNLEEEFKTWYNRHHYNKYREIATNEDMYNYRQPKEYNIQKYPPSELADEYIETIPHPKFYSKKKIRTKRWYVDDKIISSKEIENLENNIDEQNRLISEGRLIKKPGAKNPNYIESADGMPMPKDIYEESGKYFIKPNPKNINNINEKYINIINNKDLFDVYNYTTDLFFSMQRMIDGKKNGYTLPGFSATTVENMMYKNNLSDMISSEWKVYMDENLKFKESESDIVNERFDIRGNTRMRNTRQFSLERQSRDAIGSIIKYAVEAQYNISLSEVAPMADAYIEYLELLKTDLDKKGIITTEKTVKGKKVKKTVDMSIRSKELDNTIKLLKFERRKFQEGKEEHLNITLKKGINMFFRYTSFIRIGLDVVNQSKNYVSGNVQAFLAASSFDSGNYSHNDYIKAKSLIYGKDGFFWQYFNSFGKIADLDEKVLLYREYNPMQKEMSKYYSNMTYGANRKVLEKMISLNEMAYLLQDKGDTEIGMTVMFAVLNHYKYKAIEGVDAEGNTIYKKDAEGNFVLIPALEAYYKNKDGILEIRKDIEFSREDEAQLRNIVLHEIRRAQGNYPKQDQTAFEEKAVGKLMFFFRKYVVPQVLNRFGYMRPSWEGSGVSYGYYRALFAAFIYFGPRRAMAEFVLGGKSGKHGIRGAKIYQKNEETGNMEARPNPEFWQRKIEHARKDVIAIGILSMLSLLAIIRIKQADDDDRELSMLEGNAMRILWGVKGETVAMNPFAGGSKEYIKNFTQGIPFLREFNALHSGVSHALNTAYVLGTTGGEEPDPDMHSIFYQERYKKAYYQGKSGPYEKGDLRLLKDLTDLTGIKNIRNLIYPSTMVDIMRKNQ